ncbi:hypothetical protein [Corynebacterium belfantii]|nr:hypothetical protein [Corynebacterium belfantii]
MDKEKQTQFDAIRRKVLGDNYVNTTLKGSAEGLVDSFPSDF